MGFTIATYQLLGLPSLPNIYVSINGSYTVEKNLPTPGNYLVTYKIYFRSSQQADNITSQDSFLYISSIPEPADLYTLIYNNVKKTLDPFYGTSQQVLLYSDD